MFRSSENILLWRRFYKVWRNTKFRILTFCPYKPAFITVIFIKCWMWHLTRVFENVTKFSKQYFNNEKFLYSLQQSHYHFFGIFTSINSYSFVFSSLSVNSILAFALPYFILHPCFFYSLSFVFENIYILHLTSSYSMSCF